MPLYNLACRTALDADTRQRVAIAITDTHCAITGAPAAYVNVIFFDGYPLRAGLAIDAVGGVRSDGNRTPEMIERLRHELHTAIASAARLDPPQVKVALVGVPSSWVMEGGHVMAAPGAEGAVATRSPRL
jgi:phenylpyruvate tautomerase PptA (4-oxalocrotonate tautomerase family)